MIDEPRRVSQFEAETAITPTGPGRWSAQAHAAWCIGDAANGGYALTPVLRATAQLAEYPDPLSVTTHFLRPVRGDAPLTVEAESVRVGRSTGVARGVLGQDGRERLMLLAVFGELSPRGDTGSSDTPSLDGEPPRIEPPVPAEITSLPPPDACIDRRELTQGVDLPILDRLDVRIHPEHARAGASPRAVIAGWIRFADGTDPSVLTLPLFADAFPPSLYPLLGEVGWVPTVELTVHVRARPAPGWVRARFECDDLTRGRMIESGTLWDVDGRVIARSRQFGLVR